MPISLNWKAGFEVELLAPRGRSRRDLADRVAQDIGGSVARYFHPQSEPSKVPGKPLFENLTLGFKVLDQSGAWHASFVDDLTLQADLDRQRAPLSGWYRVVADDVRLLRLAMRHCDAGAAGDDVLDPLAALFGTAPQRREGGMVRIVDDRGASVAICAPLPGERERPCEIVTAPIEAKHEQRLAALLADAQQLGFTVPREGATHIHFDAGKLCSSAAFARFVRLVTRYGAALRDLVGVNPHCIRLGAWPNALITLIDTPGFDDLDWAEAREKLGSVGLGKYCDVNLVNIVNATEAKHTIEIRTLPATLDSGAIIEAAALFEGLLEHACAAPALGGEAMPELLSTLIADLPIAAPLRSKWAQRQRAAESDGNGSENLYPIGRTGPIGRPC